MKVSDVMSRDAVSATPATTYKEAVDLMLGHDVGSLPVVDDLGRVIGVVSEADLVPKAGYSPMRRRPLLALLDLLDGDDAAWRKARATTVADVMTGRPLTLHPGDDVAYAARTLVRGRRKRVPVVDDAGILVGVVSRQDLLGAFARPDAVIGDDVRAALGDPTRTPEGNEVAARVHDGVVTLTGTVATDDDHRVVQHVVRQVPGVVDVVDQIATPVRVS